MAGPVNLNAYRLASHAVRGWSKSRGIDPIKATKALSETVREAVDEVDYRMLGGYTKPAAHITPTLKAIAERTAKGTRPKRPPQGTPGTWPQNRAGYAVQRFGTNLGSELGYRPELVVRPKPSNVFNTRRK